MADELILTELRALGTELRALAAHVATLDGRLTKHMEDEEEETHEIRENLGNIASNTARLIEAMPHKDGALDLYGHRVDHDNLRHDKRVTDTIIGQLKAKSVEWVIMGIIVLLASGHYSKLIEMVVK